MLEGLGTTAAELEHYFGNNVGIARIFLIDGDLDEDFEANRKNFTSGLKRTLDRNLPEADGVTRNHLRELIALAGEGDWSDIDTIKAIYRRVYAIQNKRYDEGKLFPTRSSVSS